VFEVVLIANIVTTIAMQSERIYYRLTTWVKLLKLRSSKSTGGYLSRINLTIGGRVFTASEAREEAELCFIKQKAVKNAAMPPLKKRDRIGGEQCTTVIPFRYRI